MSRQHRRDRGEGAVFRQKGRWRAVLDLGLGADGKRRRRWLSGRDRAATLERLARLRAQALDGTLPEASALTTGAFLARWLDDVVRTTTGEKTQAIYALMVRRHITPHVGGVRLVRLMPAHVQGMLGAMERAGASANLRRRAFDILSRGLRQALRWNLIPRNPCEGVVRPRAPRPEIHPLDQAQIQRFLDAARGDRLAALYVAAVATGLRQGELLGLAWDDVDLAEGALHVRRQLHELGGRRWLGEVKTQRARRRVDLPQLAIEALREHRARMLAEGHAPHRDALVFCNERGGPIDKHNLMSRSFRQVLGRAGLPRVTFHSLRHSHATILLRAGVHPKVVQERLGHSSVVLTLDTYSHVLTGMQREAAVRLDALFRPSLGAQEGS